MPQRAKKSLKPPGLKQMSKKKPVSKIQKNSMLDLDQMCQILFENSPDLILNVDKNGKILFMNHPIPGHKVKDVIGNHLLDILPSKQGSEYIERLNRLFETGEIQFTEHDPLGSGRWWARFVPIKRRGRIVSAMIIATDITERKKVEEERSKNQKLESLGLLAGGIAHDFNNILTAILGNIALAKLSENDQSPNFKLLGEAEKASLRAKDLSHQLLTFARGGLPIKRMTFIQDLLKSSAEFALRGSNVRVDLFIPKDLWPVEVDEGQISQAIHNVIMNAQQAMAKGGIVELRAENTNLTPAQQKEFLLKEGPYLKIMVKDTGIGIPKEFLPKIFDPYFTTKQRGGGLGLSSSYSIIKGHEGHISVASALGHGTTFSLYLPAFPNAALPAKEAEKFFDSSLDTGKKHVLIMDDEESVREVGGKILAHLGYEVEYAREGYEAVKLYRTAKESGHPFDLVILDLTIPGGMGGEETVQKLIEIDPYVKAVVSSGYSDNPIMSEYQSYGFSGVVSKPYRIRDFSLALAMALNQKRK